MAVGDLVRVTGRPGEFGGQTQITVASPSKVRPSTSLIWESLALSGPVFSHCLTSDASAGRPSPAPAVASHGTPVVGVNRGYLGFLTDISPGEELFYDYGLVIDERYTPKLKKQFECRCGAKACRGTMLAPKR